MRVRWTKRARAQLLEIFDFIAAERPMTAERVVGRLDAGALLKEEAALAGGLGVGQGTRPPLLHTRTLFSFGSYIARLARPTLSG